jgi:hypothetical protein
MDDINGLATSLDFANWLKSLVDEIATSDKPLALCLLVVGLEERRQSLIRLQPSLARVFDVVEIEAWQTEETISFFENAFAKAGMVLEGAALDLLVRYAGGLPVLAHEIGEAVFNLDTDNQVGLSDALGGVVAAADTVGRKHLEPQVFGAIRSEKYRTILRKVADDPFAYQFTRSAVRESLSAAELKVFDNFLTKMKQLGVMVEDPERGRGAYRFTNLLYFMYFQLEAERARKEGKA